MYRWIRRFRGATLRALVTLLVIGAALVMALRPEHHAAATPAAASLLMLRESEGAVQPAYAFPTAAVAPPTFDSATAATDAITFGQPTIAGIQGTGFEPDIRLDPSDPQRMFVSVPASASTDTSWIWHSRDGGKTFKWVPASAPKTGKSVACPGGGDTELAVDGAGRVYFNDLTLANFSVSRSDDHGNTWPCNSTGVPSTLVDRQWYAIDGDPTALAPAFPSANSLYLASNNVGQGAPNCPVSGPANNVLVVYRSLPGPAAGLGFGAPNQVTPIGSCEEGIMGNIEVSPVPTRTAANGSPSVNPARHHVYVIHDDATFSKISVARCYPTNDIPSTDVSGLVCVDKLVSDLDPSAADPPTVRTGANFPSLAIDKTGNLYAVWQEAPVDASGNVGNVSLRYSYSTDEGETWSQPIEIPTPGLNNNVMTWAAAGDDGRVDIVWYGTPATVTPPPYSPTTCVEQGGTGTPHGGPDFANGVWSLYMTQTLNGHDSAVSFTPPIQVGEHHMHRGTVATVMGGLCAAGSRGALGDFFKLRIGTQGEANIVYSDSNSASGLGIIAHTMFIRQNGGPGVYESPQTVSGDPIQLNAVSDPAEDGKRELAPTTTSSNLPNLDILSSSLEKPSAASCHPSGTPCYRVTMQLNNLSLTPLPEAVDPVLVWLTQWLVPSGPDCVSADMACTAGGKNFHVYAESSAAGLLRCFYGENAFQFYGGGAIMTYPPTLTEAGLSQITAAGACSATTGPNGTITIDVPLAQVSLPVGVAPFNPNRLFSVTASTMTLSAASDTAPSLFGISPAGIPPDVIDVARSYDADFTPPTAVSVRAFTAKRSRQVVTLRWRTGSEAGLAGFHVFSQRGATRARLNRALIMAAGDAFGHAYSWRGKVPSRDARFWLQWVRTDGKKAWYGPARPS